MKDLAIRVNSIGEATAVIKEQKRVGLPYNYSSIFLMGSFSPFLIAWGDSARSGESFEKEYEVISFEAFAQIMGIKVATEIIVSLDPIMACVTCSVKSDKVTFKWFKDNRTSLVIPIAKIEEILKATKEL